MSRNTFPSSPQPNPGPASLTGNNNPFSNFGNYYGDDINPAMRNDANKRLLEQENERKVAEDLAGKIGLIKGFTSQIQDEVNSQNRYLDTVGSTFDRAAGGLRTTMHRLNTVMSTPQRRIIGYMVLFFVVMFFLYKLWPSKGT